ncbi:hypothetical protein Rmf_16340 [Roseomonas fluvialis]|uniref:Abasic site processing protein n=1 Tax=Roseomonas fluvialis TaxID=1750527 RepID=A0ABM9SEF7_9PROT|nr:hypothetical protein Rmf_16340 [Roseomonas fluvialis]
MCNLYSIVPNQQAIRQLAMAFKDSTGNLQPMSGAFPDYAAPIVRNTPEGRELALVRWGMPSSKKALLDAARKRADKIRAKVKPVDFDELLRREPDSGTTNIRNTASLHWKRWIGVENRCLVPFTFFSEFNREAGGDIWFARDESCPLTFFAGIWAQRWTSVRKVRTGFETIDLFGLLTTEPNAEVGPPKGDAGDPHQAGGNRNLDDRELVRGDSASAAVAGWVACGGVEGSETRQTFHRLSAAADR